MSRSPDAQDASLHVVVHGRVQGVGFRWFVRETARALQLRGWVRNLEDGTVEVMAVGPAPLLAKLDAALRRGPDGARVAHLEAADAAPGSELQALPSSFTIFR